VSKVTGSIDRTALDLDPLLFGDGSGLSLFVGGLTPGRRKWRRTTVKSPWVKGEYETGAVLDQTDDPEFRFRIRQGNEDDVLAFAEVLIAAVEQRTWDLSITVGTTDWPTLTCTRADSEIAFDTAHTRGRVATVTVFTTHKPTSDGPL
jgi:hypothetical protein